MDLKPLASLGDENEESVEVAREFLGLKGNSNAAGNEGGDESN